MRGLEALISLEKGLLLGSGRTTNGKLFTKMEVLTKVLTQTGPKESQTKAVEAKTKSQRTALRSTVVEMESGTMSTVITTCNSLL